jgi:hypothetical protein
MGNYAATPLSSKGGIELSYAHLSNQEPESEETGQSAQAEITTSEYIEFLRPYFWPRNAVINRLRCLSTGAIVSGSKICNVISPLFLSRATNSLVKMQYSNASINIIIYCLLKFMATFFKGFNIKIQRFYFPNTNHRAADPGVSTCQARGQYSDHRESLQTRA